MAQVLPSSLAFRWTIGGRRRRRDDRVLHVRVEIEAPHAPLTADPGILRAAERSVQVADEEAVDPHGPGHEPLGDPLGTAEVRGVDGGGQSEVGGVRERDGLVLVRERLRREHRPEDLLAEDLRPGGCVDEQRRPVIQTPELRGDAAAEDESRTGRLRTFDESVDPLQMGAGDQGPEIRRLLAWVPLADRGGRVREPFDEVVVDGTLDQEPASRRDTPDPRCRMLFA
jgi:hypothetical protein